jgi:hypothetical protein
MKKRVLSMILVLLMVLSVIPLAASASEGSGVYNPDIEVMSKKPSLNMSANLFSVDTDIQNALPPVKLNLNSNTTAVERYNVLVLDTSGGVDFRGAGGNNIYTADTAINYVKQSASKFISDIINADGTNYVALVTYDSTSRTVSGFSTNISDIQTKINQLTAGAKNTTDMSAGLKQADTLLNSIVGEDVIKNVVLFSTGFTMAGSYNYTGHYDANTVGSNWRNSANDVKLYAYANVAYAAAEIIKTKATLYSIGLFQNLNDIPAEGRDAVAFFKLTALDLATSSNHFYDAVDPSQLEFIFGEIAEDIIREGSGIFTYGSGRNPGSSKEFEDYQATYHYNDNYFSEGASLYKQSLSTMSLCLALSAFGSNVGGTTASEGRLGKTADYSEKFRNARDLLGKIGFSDFEANNNFTIKPSEDSMGVVIAHKNIKTNGKDYTVITLATRGGGYEAEWAGNFSIGLTGQHEGFKKASDEAYRFLSDYINRHKNEFQNEVKFWFTGYSRAGATVNLLAGRLNDEKQISGITVKKEDLYAYCFEPPMGALKNQTLPVSNYSNIHNIVNPSDPVPKVAMLAWGFARYGKDESKIPSVLTSSNSNDFKEMLDYFKTLNTDYVAKSLVKINGIDKHIIDTFQSKKIDPSIKVDIGHWEERTGWFGVKYWIYVPNFEVDKRFIANDNKTMSAFLDELLVSLSFGIGNRFNYYVKLQQAARLLVGAEGLGGGYESYKWQKVPDIFDTKIKNHIFDIAVALINSGTSGAENLVMGYLLESISEAGINLYAYSTVPNALGEALVSLARAVVVSACANGGSDLVTFFGKGEDGKINATKIFPAHYPELCLAWMQSIDKNYDGQEKTYINGYRIIRINCPVDVDVFNSEGTLVAQIINDVPQEIDSSTIVSSFNANGEKVIYLPADENYTLKIIATGDGEFSYSVNEFSYETNSYAKIVNYCDVPITVGDTMEGLAPKYNSNDVESTGDGSGIEYALSLNSNKLTPTNEMLGEDAQKAIYSVSVDIDNVDGGTAIGGGVFSEGAFAQVSAITYEKCEFVGWYKNDVMISNDAIYRFRVESDETLVAKFTGTRPTPDLDTYKLTITAGSGGSITVGANGNYSDGSITPLTAVPNSGYHFVNWTSSNGGTFTNANNASTTFTMPANDAIITANFKRISSSGSSYTNPPTINIFGNNIVKNSLITLKPSQTNSTIYYTLDGSVPTKNSEKYSNPFVITKDTTIKFFEVGSRTSQIITRYLKVTTNTALFIKKVNETKYIKPITATEFKPDDFITRYDMAESLNNLLSFGNGNVETTFGDVKDEMRKITGMFQSADIFDGFEDGTFKGTQGLTRAEFVKIMSIILKLDIKATLATKSAFKDVNGHWAESYIAEFVKLGYLKGYEDGTFKPDQMMTRAEFVTFVNRIVGTKSVSVPPVFNDLISHWAYSEIMAVYKR